MNVHLHSKSLSTSLVVRQAEQSFPKLGPIKCRTMVITAQPGHTAARLMAWLSIQSLQVHDHRQKTSFKVTQTLC